MYRIARESRRKRSRDGATLAQVSAIANPGPASLGPLALSTGRADACDGRTIMSFVAEAERTIEAPPQRVFETLVDVASWPTWMPRSFVPMLRKGVRSPLRLGDRVKVKVAGAPLPSTIRVSKLERPTEVAWRGGVRGIFWAEHRFVLEPVGDRRTRVRSIETWRGALAGLLRPLVQPVAVRVGAAQLAGLDGAAAIKHDVN